MDNNSEFKSIQQQLRLFAKERDWEKYHNPKNLSMALIVETAELVEIFQWMDSKESENIINSKEVLESVSHELADIMLYALRLSDVFKIDIIKAMNDKIIINSKKYPINKSKGNAIKYNNF